MGRTSDFIKVFLIVFAFSSLPFLVLLMIPTYGDIPILFNVACIGFTAVFSIITANNNRKSIVILPLTNYSSFISKLRRKLLNMGYQPLHCREFEMKFIHPFKFSYYDSDITVKLSYDCAIIIGPNITISYLNSYLKKI